MKNKKNRGWFLVITLLAILLIFPLGIALVSYLLCFGLELILGVEISFFGMFLIILAINILAVAVGRALN